MASINELQLAKELISFPTVTPVDAGIMRFLEKKLKTLGFKTKILEFKEKDSKPVKNLYARLGNKGPNFCYAGHLDVVPPGNLKDWTVNPLKPSVKQEHLIFSQKVQIKQHLILQYQQSNKNLLLEIFYTEIMILYLL